MKPPKPENSTLQLPTGQLQDPILDSHDNDKAAERSSMKKIALRLMPMLFLAAALNYIDRTNIGFAKLQMQSDLGLSEVAFGLGAGMFFVAYVILEVPSNLILHRVGARIWITRIMASWGIVVVLMATIQNETVFYILRFLLGAAEAGLLPGVVLYLTQWVPATRRAGLLGWFYVSIPVASMLGGPLTAILMGFQPFGLRGWQFMFILEGIPCLVLAIFIFKYLSDSPERAPWLTRDEKKWLGVTIRREQESKLGAAKTKQSALAALRDPRVLGFSLVYFSMVVPIYVMGFFLPTIVKEMVGTSVPLAAIGWITAIPYLFTAVAMVLIARSSDRRQERSWHITLTLLSGAVALVVGALTLQSAPLVAILAICLALVGCMGPTPTFWAAAPASLVGAAAASGIALISSIGNIGGFVSPYMVGLIREAIPGPAGSSAAMVVAACVLLAGSVVMWLVGRSLRRRERFADDLAAFATNDTDRDAATTR